MKKLVILTALAVCLAGCGETAHRVADKFGSKGLSKERQAEVDATVAEYREQLVGVTWHSQYSDTDYRFYEDGTVETNGVFSDAGNWTLSFRKAHDWEPDLEEATQDEIEKYFDYFLCFTTTGYVEKEFKTPVRFKDGNLWMGDDLDGLLYTPGVDFLHEIPEDAELDPYFLYTYPENGWGVWGFEEDGELGRLWIFQPDGLGAESVGTYNGELIYPEEFTWGVKDDMLYIEWNRTEEYIAENGKDVVAYRIERGEGEFWATNYRDDDNSEKQHLVQTDQVDVYEW